MKDDDGGFKFDPRLRTDGSSGIIETYIHAGGRIGAIVELRCETDFIARAEDLHTLGREIAMQVAAMNPRTVGSMDSPDQDSDSLLDQEYIRDPSKTIRDLINETIAKVGERIWVARFVRFEVGMSNV